jgi:hypothetical protein
MYENLEMHIYVGTNYNTHIMTLIHTIYGRGKCNIYTTIYGCTLYVGAKCNTHIMTLIPHYIWEREMQYLHNNLKMHTMWGQITIHTL